MSSSRMPEERDNLNQPIRNEPIKVKHLVGKYFIRVSDTESETIRKRNAIWIRGLKHMEAQRELTKQAMRGMRTVRPNMTDEPLSDELKAKMKLNGGPNQ